MTTNLYHKLNVLAFAIISCVFSIFIANQMVFAATGRLASKPVSTKYALLIGIDQYDNDAFKLLEGAKNDVKLMKDILISRFGMKAENIVILMDEKATHITIKNQFDTLAQKIKPGDMVYIHYSGHGSYTCDLNGDEDPVWAKDSTWVCYGARSTSGDSGKSCSEVLASKKAEPVEAPVMGLGQLNDYDILDDEIHTWLASLEKKTDQVIFVSDSCHSGTVSRGENALMTRGAPIDMRAHPLGTSPVETTLLSGIRVTACRDEEKANEYRENGTTHGLFTWFWAQSLQEAQPGQTWNDLYQQTCARISFACTYPQRPQIEGEKNQTVFGGEFQEKVRAIPITYVSHDGQNATIGAGSLVRVTKGSVYRKYNPDFQNPDSTTLEITLTEPTRSKGRVSGSLKVGDMMVLEHYQNISQPMKVLIRADLEKDIPMVEKLREAVNGLSSYEVTTDQKESQFVLQVLRPKKGTDGACIYKSENDNLPMSFDEQPSECWILNEHEQLYNPKLKISIKDREKSIEAICSNLRKIAKVKNLTTLFSAPGQESPIELNITIWREASADQTEGIIKVEGKRWYNERTVTAKSFEEYDLKINSLLSFSVYNKSDKDYYVYLVDVTSDADIIPFYPTPLQNTASAIIRAGYERKIEDVTLLIDQPVREYIRLIATLEPIDIYVLGQKGFAQRSARAKLSPLEQLLTTKSGCRRGKISAPMPAAAWSTVQGTFMVR